MPRRLAILLQFTAIGALLFAGTRVALARRSRRRSRSGPDALAEIRAEGLALFGRAPEGAELDALVEARVADELLYREALARGLDREDRSVRRRLARNVAFLRAAPGEPDVPGGGRARGGALPRGARARHGPDRHGRASQARAARAPRDRGRGARGAFGRRSCAPGSPRTRSARSGRRACGSASSSSIRRGAARERAEADARAAVRGAQLREPPAAADPCLVAAEQPLQAEPAIARLLGAGARRGALRGAGRRVGGAAPLVARLARGAGRGARRRRARALRGGPRRGARRRDRGAQRRRARALPRRAPRARPRHRCRGVRPLLKARLVSSRTTRGGSERSDPVLQGRSG